MQIEAKIRDHIDSTKLNDVDVTVDVMSKIRESSKEKSMFINKKLAVALLVAIFITTTGFATLEFIKFKDGKGSLLWVYVKTSRPEAYKILDKKLNEIEVAEGEAVVLMIKKDGVFTGQIKTKDMKTTDFAVIEGNMTEGVVFPEVISEDYSFVKGEVHLNADDIGIKEMEDEYDAAEKDEDGIYIKRIRTEMKLDKAMRATYESGKKRVSLAIIENFGKSLFDDAEDSANTEKIEIDKYGVLYKDDHIKSLTWIKNDHFYRVSTESSEVTKDEMIEMVKKVMSMN